MLDLNPLHLENASLLHFLMVQGTAILSFLIFRNRFRRQVSRLAHEAQCLQADLDKYQLVEPDVEEVFAAMPGLDDLKEIAGIGPKAEAILNSIGIFQFAQLAETPVSTVWRVLSEHGPLLYTYDPTTWPSQAWLAAEGRWDELRSWQEQMRRGVYQNLTSLLLP